MYWLGFGLKQILSDSLDLAIAMELVIPATGCEMTVFISRDLWLPVPWRILHTPCNHC